MHYKYEASSVKVLLFYLKHPYLYVLLRGVVKNQQIALIVFIGKKKKTANCIAKSVLSHFYLPKINSTLDFIIWNTYWSDIHMCSSGTLMVAPEAYKPWVGGLLRRCGTWVSLGVNHLMAKILRSHPFVTKPWGTGSPKRTKIDWCESCTHIKCVVVVHSWSLQKLINHEWEGSLTDVGFGWA